MERAPASYPKAGEGLSVRVAYPRCPRIGIDPNYAHRRVRIVPEWGEFAGTGGLHVSTCAVLRNGNALRSSRSHVITHFRRRVQAAR
jgi:hypothetical protein